MTETVTKPLTLSERLDAAMEAVWAADSAWAADLANPEAKAAYKAAKAAYKVLAREAEDKGLAVQCDRCGGEGGWKGWPGYTCFKCLGSGKMPFRPVRFQAMPSTRAKNAAKAQAKAQAEQERQTANYASFRAEHPEAAALLDEYLTWDEYVEREADDSRHDGLFSSLKASACKYGGLTEKQMQVVTREITKRAEQAAATPFPSGTHTVQGEVVGTKDTPGYGGGTKWNMIVKLSGEHAGNTVMGTIPAKLLDLLEDHETQTTKSLIGARVEFTATFTQGREDHFGFLKSPKQVKLIGHTDDDERSE